jgi:hypothetical protein
MWAIVAFFGIGLAMPFAESHQPYSKPVQEILNTLNTIAVYLGFPLMTINEMITGGREKNFLIYIANGLLLSYLSAQIATWLKNHRKT